MKNKRILVAVSGGIAAYKAVELVSRLRKAGAEVKVVMTENATKFITPLTFGELSNHPVAVNMWDEVHDWNVEHIALASWADAYVIAPATANVIGKIAHGIADDMLTTTVMATKAPVYICPAMNTNMYTNPIVRENINYLRQQGYHILEPNCGLMACGTSGVGRLPEPEEIVEWLDFELHKTELLKGKTLLITAGGTKEAIDPVRYITNRSSGKMGYALAQEAARQGAKTILITTTDALPVPYGVECITVDSARSMKHAVDAEFEKCDCVIMAAAVSDFRAEHESEQKIKKMETMSLPLIKNPDILFQLGERKTHQKLVGFAAETNDLLSYGRDKLIKKNLDMLVANDVGNREIGFNVDVNEVTVMYKNGTSEPLPRLSKQETAKEIILRVAKLLL